MDPDGVKVINFRKHNVELLKVNIQWKSISHENRQIE